MVSSCCVWGCTVRKTVGSGMTFFSFPNAKRKPAQRQKWIAAIKRTTDSSKVHLRTEGAVSSGSGIQWEPKKGHYVCPRHFVTGKELRIQNSEFYYCCTIQYSNLQLPYNTNEQVNNNQKITEVTLNQMYHCSNIANLYIFMTTLIILAKKI
jgi:hypothetical protein